MVSPMHKLKSGRYAMTRRSRSFSPLDSADAAFRLLTRGPQPLAVDGRRIGGALPPRRIPLDELKRLLLRPSAGPRTRDAAWTVLAVRARRRGPSWVVGAVGVALPGLRRAAGKLARGYTGDPADIDAEVLVGFLAALRSADISRPAIALRLRWAAYRAGAAFRYADTADGARHAAPIWATAPPRPWGHPDFVLADAVAQGVISAADAELIAATRLENIPLIQAARDLDVPYDTARMRRSRAETRLAQAISDELIKSRVFG
jgi:DNA-directed RNA polymerase specialized sigma24 family protein